MAVASYAIAHKHYPPPYLGDELGKPMHSWRILMLPYLSQNDVYKAYDFSEPWNGGTNAELGSRMPRVYAFPGQQQPGNTTTNYLAVVGLNTLWQGPVGVPVETVKAANKDVILIVENKGAGIHWMEPRDLLFDDMDLTLKSPKGISSRYVDPAVVTIYSDIIRLTDKIEPDTLRKMLTIDHDEKVAADEQHGWDPIPDGRQRAVAEP